MNFGRLLDALLTLGELKFEQALNDLTITMPHTNIYTGQESIMRIQVGAPGDLTILGAGG